MTDAAMSSNPVDATGDEARSEGQANAVARKEPGRGREAVHPRQFPGRGWRDILWRVLVSFNANRLAAAAAAVTFFTLLALFPAITAFVSLYGLFNDVGTAREPLVLLEGLVPEGVLDFIGDEVERIAAGRSSDLTLAFGGSLLLSLWSANASMKSLFEALNIAYHETEKRNIVVFNATTLFFTLCGLLFLLTVVALVVVTPLVLNLVGWDSALAWLTPLRWPLLLLMQICALAVLYRYAPSRRNARWRWVRWGSVVAALMWVGVGWLFSWYLSSVADYAATYGSLGTVMGFMFWTYLSTIVVLFGAQLNAEMEHQTAQDTTVAPEKPLGERGALVADTIGPKAGAPDAARFTVNAARELSRRAMLRKSKQTVRAAEVEKAEADGEEQGS
ncbi:MAG: YihY/virulence factor BrkB family protein [Proteobacteria bacterium]|nr:YihY/virulence factor BrkB family protein [Pseudomonadota bacterium]